MPSRKVLLIIFYENLPQDDNNKDCSRYELEVMRSYNGVKFRSDMTVGLGLPTGQYALSPLITVIANEN
jgi:hypothetical protein